MTSIAAQFLIARFKGLYDEREEKANVIIVSSDTQGSSKLFSFYPYFEILFFSRSFVFTPRF